MNSPQAYAKVLLSKRYVSREMFSVQRNPLLYNHRVCVEERLEARNPDVVRTRRRKGKTRGSDGFVTSNDNRSSCDKSNRDHLLLLFLPTRYLCPLLLQSRRLRGRERKQGGGRSMANPLQAHVTDEADAENTEVKCSECNSGR